jgi:hypothetical protein
MTKKPNSNYNVKKTAVHLEKAVSEENEESGSSGSEEEPEEEDEETVESGSSSPEEDMTETNAFKLKPLDPKKDFNEDGTAKFVAKSKLMLKLEQTVMHDDSDEGIDNSFAECGSDEDSEESDETEEEDAEASDLDGADENESEEESVDSPVRKKKK